MAQKAGAPAPTIQNDANVKVKKPLFTLLAVFMPQTNCEWSYAQRLEYAMACYECVSTFSHQCA